MPSPLEFHFDFSSPYGYLGSEKIEALATRHGRTVEWRPMLLGAAFKATGSQPLTTIPIKGDYTKRDLPRSARFHRVELRMPDRFPIATQNPARIVVWQRERERAGVSAAGEAAAEPRPEGRGDAQAPEADAPAPRLAVASQGGRVPALVHALYRAYFVANRDISDPDVAADVAATAGVDRAAARAAIDDPAVKDALRRDVEAALAKGVFGSPFVFADGEPFWGIDRFDQIDRWLAEGGF